MSRFTWGLLALGFLAASCAPQVQLKTLRPAEVDTGGIRRVAVGPFEIMGLNERLQSERNGQWTTQPVQLSAAQKQALSDQIRAQVVARLAATPYYELIYTDEFAALDSDEKLQAVIAAAGYRDRQTQAVISGRVWIELVKTDGAMPKKTEMDFVAGGRSDLSLSVEKMVWWPYKALRGNLTLELKMTQLVPTEVVAASIDTRRYAHRIGGEPLDFLDQIRNVAQDMGEGGGEAEESQFNVIEGSDQVLPSFEQLTGILAASVATDFIRKISVTESRQALSVATGGDQRGKLLVEAGAYGMAIDRLQQVTAQAPQGDDLYNLGLAYEASGEYGLARLTYREALKLQGENPLYAQGLGRIERMLRQKPRLRSQLSDKGTK
ncbi:MAG: hypothetical protein RRB13_10080 [bacterium]|nr:hypothetical protein [bacterium]